MGDGSNKSLCEQHSLCAYTILTIFCDPAVAIARCLG